VFIVTNGNKNKYLGEIKKQLRIKRENGEEK
jgi:hypothetical protein